MSPNGPHAPEATETGSVAARASFRLHVVLGVALIALFSVLNLHDMFAFYRARLALTDELQAAGVAPAQLDGGWEYNAVVDIRGQISAVPGHGGPWQTLIVPTHRVD
jgi:hypothetical protein